MLYFSQTASTGSNTVTSSCLPSAEQLSRWINPPTLCQHLSTFSRQVVPFFPREADVFVHFPKLCHLIVQGRPNRQAACNTAVSWAILASPKANMYAFTVQQVFCVCLCALGTGWFFCQMNNESIQPGVIIYVATAWYRLYLHVMELYLK